MKLAVAIGKIAVLAAWLWGLASFIVPTTVPAPDIGRMVFFGLLAVHIAEAFIYAKTLAQESDGSTGSHAGQLVIFGYFHVLGVRYG